MEAVVEALCVLITLVIAILLAALIYGTVMNNEAKKDLVRKLSTCTLIEIVPSVYANENPSYIYKCQDYKFAVTDTKIINNLNKDK